MHNGQYVLQPAAVLLLVPCTWAYCLLSDLTPLAVLPLRIQMGLGKTVQAVCVLECLRAHGGVSGPFLIVSPLSVLDTWKKEIEAWTDLVRNYNCTAPSQMASPLHTLMSSPPVGRAAVHTHTVLSCWHQPAGHSTKRLGNSADTPPFGGAVLVLCGPLWHPYALFNRLHTLLATGPGGACWEQAEPQAGRTARAVAGLRCTGWAYAQVLGAPHHLRHLAQRKGRRVCHPCQQSAGLYPNTGVCSLS